MIQRHLPLLAIEKSVHCFAAQDEDFTLPLRVQQQMAIYAARFQVVKTPRKLVWMKSLGSVDLSLTVGGLEIDFAVAPIHAAIILRFKV